MQGWIDANKIKYTSDKSSVFVRLLEDQRLGMIPDPAGPSTAGRVSQTLLATSYSTIPLQKRGFNMRWMIWRAISDGDALDDAAGDDWHPCIDRNNPGLLTIDEL